MVRISSLIKYSSLCSPIGTLFVATSKKGICDVTFFVKTEAAYCLDLLHLATEVTHDREALSLVFGEFDDYFSGQKQRFSTPVDLRNLSEFTVRVLHEVRRIPFGELRSYGEIARRIGFPGASRAVGKALNRNPIPIIVPCHRVISHRRQLYGFSGGILLKQKLLCIEGHSVPGHTSQAYVV